MKISKIEVKNYRILKNASLDIEEDVTLIVGRNNSGKTSLTEVFYSFFGDDHSRFRFEDFSIACYNDYQLAYSLFCKSLAAKGVKKDEFEKQYIELLPRIELSLFIEYDQGDDGKLATINDYIMDLDPDRKDIYICCKYLVQNVTELMNDFKIVSKTFGNNLINYLRNNYAKYYCVKYFAFDRLDPAVYKEIEKPKKIANIFDTQFIAAQRRFDDQSKDRSKTLSKGFEKYYQNNKEQHQKDVSGIDAELTKFSNYLNRKYETLFKGVFDDLSLFGITNNANIPKLLLKAFFDSEKILNGNTQLFYKHDDEENLLPESYNGLGYSNLIYMILQFVGFFEVFDKMIPRPNFQIIFIEEPEVHLHPQMQHVFIKNIKDFIKRKRNWKVQVIITTHSSHIIEESGFLNIRYFDNSKDEIEIKNLSEFSKNASSEVLTFLKQYMTLKKCDMFFADKVIMAEGTVERLLLPEIINKGHLSLKSQYLSIIEIGGAYAHKFADLLDFIGVKTLIITDIDSINIQKESCPVKKGITTSNAVLKNWLPQISSLHDLVKLKSEKKVNYNKKIRVAYQVPEIGNKLDDCGRSFEEAFILKNSGYLAYSQKGEEIKRLFSSLSNSEIRDNSFALAKQLQNKKTDFAFDIMLLDQWDIPKYIEEGLSWLER